MRFESGNALAARKWISSAYVASESLRSFIDAFPKTQFYRGGKQDDLAARADVALPEWYRLQRKSLIGPCFDEPGGVGDARLRFTHCDYKMAHDEHFSGGNDRDWFVLTHFGYASDEDRRHLLGACGMLPIGVRFGYHLYLTIFVRKPTDKRIFAVHLDELRDAVAQGGEAPALHAVFKTYASMLNAVGEIRKGNGSEIVKRI